MKLEVFKYLAAIEKYGSLNQAAEHLYVSQPNLTNVIHSLERELGYPVLARNHRGVQFTDQGRQILLAAHNILREREKLSSIGTEQRSVRLKISIGNYDGILEELCVDLTGAEAGYEIDLTIRNLPVMEAMRSVYHQQLDLAYMIVPTEIDQLIRDYAESHGLLAYFFREQMCQITLRDQHPLLQSGFSKDRLWNYPFVDFVGQYPEAYGVYRRFINPRKKIMVDYGSLRKRIVANSDAYTIGIHLLRPAQEEHGLVSIPTPDLRMHLVEIRREADRDNAAYQSLRWRVERRVASASL